ncbi:NAD(P)H-binding protein [Ponticaulis koreensis]|uniref:NAD(P)H-binding protein n=1 Tax=Ponticaulis koreensis TaxID=1123045 RepID=UPI0003B7B93C|nr:NAD(P)H-binding protein [Ponticaulis koreensis]
MEQTLSKHSKAAALTLILGATGKTGSRIYNRLEDLGVPVRKGSRSASPAFDWDNEAGWDDVLSGVEAVYINYAPDLAVPGATDKIQGFVEKAIKHGVKRAVLLSGRGEEEAQASEAIVQNSGLSWTIIRASWFFQNFSEGMFLDMVRSGQLTLPESDTPEPFVDVDDIADIAIAALTKPGHEGRLYEVTGPRAMTFAQVADELAKATQRPVTYIPLSHEQFIDGIRASGAPKDVIWLVDYLFATVMDGRNVAVILGVPEALGRPATDFSDFARKAAATGLWEAAQ